jgi:hypothetical protein
MVDHFGRIGDVAKEVLSEYRMSRQQEKGNS